MLWGGGEDIASIVADVTIPATSQLERLISMTAINVLAGSRATRDRLRSFNFCMGRSIGSHQRRWMRYPRRRPIAHLWARRTSRHVYFMRSAPEAGFSPHQSTHLSQYDGSS